MQQIINFLIRNKNGLLFFTLFALAFYFTVESHSYHKSKWINSTNVLSGGILNTGNSIGSYFNLKQVNKSLVKENINLRHQLEYYNNLYQDSTYIDSSSYNSPYKFFKANVISNSFAKRDNYIIINRGGNDSLKPDMGVITTNGILGIIEETSSKYARVISILNSNLELNVSLKKSNHFGTLSWNGDSPYTVQLSDVGRLAPVKVGDTIITSGNSAIFPKGIMVGTIQDFKLDESRSYYTINISLFNDMTNLSTVYAIKAMPHQDIIDIQTTEDINE